ncbi:gliding motility-associated ABC transporter substrate-binding protein GldG [Flavobacterium agricola]|uniref:Gliding motility-associated ABC transporter substrate-binding protein GldG n=1 Tax=Flavobacterium agricola TaxID=2870839 RepID=A0ABY6LXT7_9FLAO|nr:gliding motility-associated ABC transporter substrate-binding protein GldG [Flavobacterium agricola]UYW01121.1 gliding motility-associated ABC transporter substrate-binding protein GldG [Flavobacterium agricola]
MKASNKKALGKFVTVVAVLVVANLVSLIIFKRFDLTSDKRYTLSAASHKIIEQVTQPLFIDVLLDGNFPAEFKRLQYETKQMLEEFSAYNSNIQFTFVNPMDEEEGKEDQVVQELFSLGLKPITVTVDDKGKQSQQLVFPWAIANYGEQSARIQLLKNMMGATTQEKVISSVQHLEYAIAEAIQKITQEKSKKIAVIKDVGELHDLQIADFLIAVRENYHIAPFTLDSVAINPNKTLQDLETYDLVVVAKPTKPFTDQQKLVLDQYMVNGGKSLWFIDAVQADMDSLYNENGSTLAYPRNLNLDDFFFKQGIRIKPMLIKDEYATPIKLASGEMGSQTQYEQYPWKLAPYVYPAKSYVKDTINITAASFDYHPIVKNVDGIKFDFANPIEILKGKLNKTVLLNSSQYSKAIGTPFVVSLDLVDEPQPDPADYVNGFIPLAVLVEGNFESMYKNRVLPFKDPTFKEITDKEGKMIVVADGDVIKNQIDQNGVPRELGYDYFSSILFGNKDFVLNSVNYLLDDVGLLDIRAKDVSLPLLDKERVYKNYTTIQIITITIPIGIILIFGLIFIYLRKKMYVK